MLTALSSATGDAVLKAGYSHLSPGRMAVVRSIAPLPFLLPVLFFIRWPILDIAFYKTVAILLPFEILALVLYMKALKTSPLSLTIPFLAFTPVFIVITGWMILGEKVSPAGLAGILLTVSGTYMLHFNMRQWGLLEPFRAIVREKGSVLMLGVAAIYSITSVLGKRAVQQSDPIFFACFYFLILGLVVPPVMLLAESRAGSIRECFRPSLPWIGIGLSQAIMVMTHMWAISLVTAAYMIAVKRTSLIFSVIYGKLFFREEHMPQRLTGACLMALGVAIITAMGS